MPPIEPLNTAFVSSYVPRKCGIATFTHDLASAVAGDVFGQPLANAACVRIAALEDREGAYDYGPEVALRIRQHRRQDYRTAAEVLNTSRVDAVSLQHEYGLFGGIEGQWILDLLDRLETPLVSTLHTVLSQPNTGQRTVLHRVCERSSKVVVMADRARRLLSECYGVPTERIRLIHHGVPDAPFADPADYKSRFQLAGRPTVLTFGLLSPNKGIELMLEALARVVPDFPDLAYIVLGATHPGVRRESGEQYRLSLERRAVELGIQRNVQLYNRYVSTADLLDYLLAADLYVTPYPGKEQITSGTLAYALASGRAIISTPYWYAQELLAGGRGRLVGFGDVDALAGQLAELLSDPRQRQEIREAAYAFGRQMVWPRVAAAYVETCAEVRRTHAETVRPVAPSSVSLRMSLPEVGLGHYFVMTDGTGMLQHAVYATPDRRHGYSADDNARAAIVAAMIWSLFQDERVLAPMHVYLSYLHDAQLPESRRFRNFMSYDRRWLETDGSDDCQGRVLWALGYVLSHAPNDSTRRLATELFRSAMPGLEKLCWPRSWAFGILGAHYYLRQFENDAAVRDQMARLADRLEDLFAERAGADWPWPEDPVTYDNGRLPQALIIAGVVLGRRELVDRGIAVLGWLLEVQTAEAGHLSIIGNDGWLHRGGDRPQYDQQPVEPAALIGACKAAYRATGDEHWRVEMRRCFEWYLGRNDCAQALVDFKTRGCYDGIAPDGLNGNQGAESVLSWLLSLLIMHEMQNGDAPEVALQTATQTVNPG
ncbi:MAG: glycosyltransferase [bacterium]|nr:glycosyltransferase [bacterium]